MPRTVDALIVSHLESKKIKPFYLIEAEFELGTIYLTNAARDITWNGNTFFATGNCLSFDGWEESLKLEGTTATIKLSGITDTIKGIILEQEYTGNRLVVYAGYFDENDQIIDEPFVKYSGKMDGSTFTDDFKTQTAEVSVPVVSQWARFDEIKGRKSNPSEQKTLYPTDTIFDNVPGLVDKFILF